MDLRCLLSQIKRQSISYSQFLQPYLSLADSIFRTYCESVHLLTPSHGLTRNVCSACPLSFADTAEMTQNQWFLLTKACLESYSLSQLFYSTQTGTKRVLGTRTRNTMFKEPIFNRVLKVRSTTIFPKIIVCFPVRY